ncbi:MAG: extracellular solute-binding protein, partial [Lachnospiraceae bacterium]|nr:extracellular solute-binding protein [Lachnospiraceae bacterium]
QQGVESNALITSGQIIALDDLIEEYGENVKKNFPSRVEFSKKYVSNGEDKTYFIPVLGYTVDKENPDISYTIENVGLMTRWDVYAAIGYPEISTTDDYLDVLKQMQDYARDNRLAEDKQIYAISGWNDWGLWPWWLANVRELGWKDLNNGAIINMDTKEVDLNYHADAFWESLKFYNKAYNMGILDPEAFTMKNDQFWDKCNNGQVLMAYASWQTDNINKTFVANGHPQWGFEKIPQSGYPYIYGIVASDAPLGNGSDYATAITKNCKYPEKAMQLIDFCNSEEGARLIYSGVEGVHWENVDGTAQPTEEYKKLIKEDSAYTTNTGITLYNKLCGYKETQVLSDGTPANVLKSNEQKAQNVLDIDKAYCEYWSEKRGEEYLYPGMVLNDMWQDGEVDTFTEYIMYTTLVQSPSEETLNILAQCDQYMNVQGVKVIMAKDDAEFEAYKEEALQELEAKGFSQAREEIISLYAAAKEEAGSFELK